MIVATVALTACLLQVDKPWKIRITSEDEPGIPMIVAGRVVDSNGTPLPAVKVYVYHTDAKGLYHRAGESGFRLNGTMWTNSEGKFEFRTIRPAPYPGAKSGEHFHFKLSEGGLPASFAFIEFYDDRPTNKLVVGTGKEGGSSKYFTGFAWKPDAKIKGQRLEVDLKVDRS